MTGLVSLPVTGLVVVLYFIVVAAENRRWSPVASAVGTLALPVLLVAPWLLAGYLGLSLATMAASTAVGLALCAAGMLMLT